MGSASYPLLTGTPLGVSSGLAVLIADGLEPGTFTRECHGTEPHERVADKSSLGSNVTTTGRAKDLIPCIVERGRENGSLPMHRVQGVLGGDGDRLGGGQATVGDSAEV